MKTVIRHEQQYVCEECGYKTTTPTRIYCDECGAFAPFTKKEASK